MKSPELSRGQAEAGKGGAQTLPEVWLEAGEGRAQTLPEVVSEASD